VRADHHGHGAGLAAVEILLALDAPVLARGDVVAHLLLVVDHHAVRPAVDPPIVGVAGHVEAARSQVAAAVVRVPLGRRELQDVHIVAGHDVLHDRAIRHLHVGEGIEIVEPLAPRLLHLRQGHVVGDPQREGDAGVGVERVDQDAKPRGVARNVVEEGGRRAHRVVQHVRCLPDVLIDVGALDGSHEPHGVDLLDPVTQIRVRQVTPSGSAGKGLDGHDALSSHIQAGAWHV
jgi:hypothetical protein